MWTGWASVDQLKLFLFLVAFATLPMKSTLYIFKSYTSRGTDSSCAVIGATSRCLCFYMLQLRYPLAEFNGSDLDVSTCGEPQHHILET